VHAGRFIIAPPWDVPADPGEHTVIVIEPSMGFGTGHHATTRLCLRLLSGLDVSDRTVLDIGTGSGVLSMAAALGGARRVFGIDVDQDAINSAEASAALNTLPDTITFAVGDFRADRAGLKSGPYAPDRAGLESGPYVPSEPYAPADLVLANLTGGMLISNAAAVTALVRPGGRAILSGFDQSEAGAVVAAFTGLAERAHLTEEGWVAVILESVGS
jgi:ribosomal protein L11 methyltransferase